MKFPKIAFVCLLAAMPALHLFASEKTAVKVEASRALSLAIVDLDRKNPASDPLHEAFKESLSYEMSQVCQMPTPVKPVKVDASRAGWGLGTGAYDVAVVIGGSVPKTMISSAFTVLKAEPESGDTRRMICLITRNEDPGLARLLAQSFPEALKGAFFQKALLRYSGQPEAEATQWKIAGIGN